MALNINSTYTNTTAADASYPYGSAKNETSPGALDGTPLEKAGLDDLYGLMQSLLSASGIVPNGNPDTVLAPQYLASIFNLRWYNKVDFAVGTKVVGSDGVTYVCAEANGPSSTIQNPVSESTPRTKWLSEAANTFATNHPVGKLYISLDSTDPGDLYGVGTWKRVSGKFLVGLDEADTDFDTSGEMGGTKTHSHGDDFAVDDHTLTVDQMPNHSHEYSRNAGGSNVGSDQSYPEQATTLPEEVTTQTSGSTGGGGAHSHGLSGGVSDQDLIPPYMVFHMWYRML